jgi:hypothetical protein
VMADATSMIWIATAHPYATAELPRSAA